MESDNNAPRGQDLSRDDNAQVFLDLCKSHYLIQDKYDSQFSTKALAIATFSLVLFGTGTSWVGSREIDLLDWGILVASAIITIIIAVTAITAVVRPYKWSSPGNLSEFHNCIYDVSKVTLLDNIARTYMRAVSENNSVSESRGKRLKIITGLFVVEIALVVLFRICLLFPD